MFISKTTLCPSDDITVGGYPENTEKIVIKYDDWGSTFTYDFPRGAKELSFPKKQLVRNTAYAVAHLPGYFYHTGNYSVLALDKDGGTLEECRFTVIEPDFSDVTVFGALYEKTAKHDGYAGGVIRIKPGEGFEKVTAYRLRYANDAGELENYDALGTFFHSGPYEAVFVIDEATVFPVEATKINVHVLCGRFESKSLYEIPIRHEARIKDEVPLYRFEVVSDVHLRTGDSESQLKKRKNFAMALQYVKKNFPDTKGLFIAGDNVNNGFAEEYEILKKIKDENLPEGEIPVYFTIGNHEKQKGTFEIWDKYLGIDGDKINYTVDLPGAVALMISGEIDFSGGEQLFSEKTLKWIDEVLEKAESENKLVYAFSHHPLRDTVAGSLESLDPAWQVWNHVKNEKDLKDVLKKHKNIVYFTGHSHWDFDSLMPIRLGFDDYGMGDVVFINTPSLGELWSDLYCDYYGCQGFLVEVWKNRRIRIKGYDFASGKYSGRANFCLEFR